MLNWRARLTALIGVFLACLFLLPPAALAQSSSGLNIEISPLPIELTAKPGTVATADLRVRNSGSQVEKIKTSIKLFNAEGEDGHIVFREPTPGDEVPKWVSFSRTVFDAPAGQWQTVKMTVNLPKTAAFGYYYAVQFELANPPKPKPGQAGLQGAVATFVLLNADAPGAVRQAQVKSFSADHRSYEFLPVSFRVQVHNSGNVHLPPRGNIFIKRGKSQVAVLPVNATLGNVLPASNRIFTAEWKDGFPVYEDVVDANGQPVKDEHGKVKRHLKWDFSHANRLRIGHYTADLVLIYNDGQRDIPIHGTLSFWVVPWRLLIGILIILTFGLIGMWSTFRRIGRRASSIINRRKGKV